MDRPFKVVAHRVGAKLKSYHIYVGERLWLLNDSCDMPIARKEARAIATLLNRMPSAVKWAETCLSTSPS